MARLLWLPAVLRAAGLTVHEVAGWRDRGGDFFDPQGIVCHATAGSRGSSDAGEIRVLLTGSETAPPPIAQLYLGRNGHFHVVASGRCNHALTGWSGPLKGRGNAHLIGIEAANDNRGEPWPSAQLDAYQRGVAAICEHMDWSPERHVAAHREHQPYPPPPWTRSSKSDPHGIDMHEFRTRVAAILAGEQEADDMTPAEKWVLHVMNYRLEALRANRPIIKIPARPDLDKAGYEEPNLLAVAVGADNVDEQAMAAAVVPHLLAVLTPTAIAAAIPPEFANQVVDELVDRLRE